MPDETYRPKRKTKTSSAVKNRYNAKTYKKFQASVKPELYDRIKAYTDRESISNPEFLGRAMDALEQ